MRIRTSEQVAQEVLEETAQESGNRRETKRHEKKTKRGMKGTVNGHQIPTGSGKDRPERAIPISADEEKSARTKHDWTPAPEKKWQRETQHPRLEQSRREAPHKFHRLGKM